MPIQPGVHLDQPLSISKILLSNLKGIWRVSQAQPLSIRRTYLGHLLATASKQMDRLVLNSTIYDPFTLIQMF